MERIAEKVKKEKSWWRFFPLLPPLTLAQQGLAKPLNGGAELRGWGCHHHQMATMRESGESGQADEGMGH